VELKKLYSKFLKFKERHHLKDVQFWFGVEKVKFSKKQIKEILQKYERDSFLNFLKNLKDIIFSQNPLDLVLKWSTDQWSFFYHSAFLKKEGIVDFEKNGRVRLLKKTLLNFFPRPRSENEIKEIIEKKLKMKLPLEAPSNFPFGTKVNAQYDQLPISISSTIFVVKKILDYLPLNKKFLFVGDDDLVSLYLSLTEPKVESMVVDIDEGLFEKIREISKKFNLKIETKKVDITKVQKLKENFVGFLTSPVYTYEGIKGFVNFGVSQFGQDGGYGFLNLSDEAIGNRILFLEKFFAEKNLKIEEIILGKVYYPWRITHPEDEVIFERLKKIFDEKIIKKSPLIGASLWIFDYLPFKVPKPKKQPFYAYL
jgi:hypothetical protein